MFIKAFTDKVPFQTVPEDVLFILVGQQHKRLCWPTSGDAANHGLTNEMWELLWKCSNLTSSQHPQFSNIAVTMMDLLKCWQPVASEQSHDAFGEILFYGLELSS